MKEKEKEKFLLKDHLFNKKKVAGIATEIQQVYPAFRKDAFVRAVVAKFPELELKARIIWIADCLKKYLPSDYRQAVGVLLQALPAPNDPSLSDGDFGDFIYAPYAEFVAQHGCTKEHLTFSLAALQEMTMRFSAEDAIRYFINAYPQQTLQALLQMSTHKNYHVRRLCSEGTRPKLPWSQKLNIPATEALPILDRLFADTTRYVTRSVANHLNDIAKIAPELVIDRLKTWQQSGKQAQDEMSYITQHALRTLIKQGHPQALQLMGIAHEAPIGIDKVKVSKRVKMNTVLAFSFTLRASADTAIIVDYIIHFQNKAGQLASKKVFKLKKATLKKGEPLELTKQHMIKQFMTTRTVYAGKHLLELQINGKSQGQYPFVVV